MTKFKANNRAFKPFVLFPFMVNYGSHSCFNFKLAEDLLPHTTIATPAMAKSMSDSKTFPNQLEIGPVQTRAIHEHLQFPCHILHYDGLFGIETRSKTCKLLSCLKSYPNWNILSPTTNLYQDPPSHPCLPPQTCPLLFLPKPVHSSPTIYLS